MAQFFFFFCHKALFFYSLNVFCPQNNLSDKNMEVKKHKFKEQKNIINNFINKLHIFIKEFEEKLNNL